MNFAHFFGVLVFLPVLILGDESTDCGPDMVTCSSLADCVPPGKCPEGAPAANQTRIGRWDNDWDNGWDEPLRFECPKTGYPINRIESYHRNSVEDRRFKFYCSENQVPLSGNNEWFFNQNKFDQYMDFNCPRSGFLTGVASYHDNHHEERIWSFRCFIPNQRCHFYDCKP